MTDTQNSADGLSAATKRMAQILDAPFVRRDTQNSAGVSEIDAVFTFAAMHHYDLSKAEAELAAMRAYIAAEPDRMRDVVEVLAAVRACRLAPREILGVHGPYQSSGAWSIVSLTKLLPRIDAAIRAQEIKP